MNIVIVPADTCSLYDADMSFLTNLDGTPGNLYLSQMARLWKLSHDARLYRTSELLQEMLRNKAAGYFSGDELFYGMIELMSNTKKIFSEPQAFLQAFDSWLGLASSLDSPKVRELLDYLDGSGRKTIKVSDAIVIYAIEHPENVEVEKAHVSCDKSGRMQLKRGNSHSIIRGFDVKHFDSYFRKRMLGVQKLKAIPPARKQRQVA